MNVNLLLVITMVICGASNVAALKCYTCVNTGGSCKGELETCPTVAGLVFDECVKFDGSISGSVSGIDVSFSGVARSCNANLPSLDPPPLRCLTGSEATAYMKEVVKDLVPEGTEIPDDLLGITITGDLCFCNEDGCNGVGSLQPFLWLVLTVGLMHQLLK